MQTSALRLTWTKNRDWDHDSAWNHFPKTPSENERDVVLLLSFILSHHKRIEFSFSYYLLRRNCHEYWESLDPTRTRLHRVITSNHPIGWDALKFTAKHYVRRWKIDAEVLWLSRVSSVDVHECSLMWCRVPWRLAKRLLTLGTITNICMYVWVSECLRMNNTNQLHPLLLMAVISLPREDKRCTNV